MLCRLAPGGARACAGGGRCPRHVAQGGGREPRRQEAWAGPQLPELPQLRTRSQEGRADWGRSLARTRMRPRPRPRNRKWSWILGAAGAAEPGTIRAGPTPGVGKGARGFRRARRAGSSVVVPGRSQASKREGSGGRRGLAALPLAVSGAGGARARLPRAGDRRGAEVRGRGLWEGVRVGGGGGACGEEGGGEGSDRGDRGGRRRGS